MKAITNIPYEIRLIIVMTLLAIGLPILMWSTDKSKAIEYRQPTMSVVTQSLNTSYRLSLYRDAMVTYSIQIASTLNLTAGQSGTALLQISPDNAAWTTVATQVNNNNGSLTLGLTTNTQSTNLTGFVPATYYVRVATSGTSTFTWMSGQQVLL